MQRYFETLADARGNVQAGLSVLVKIGGQNATIYSDNGTTVQANPITSDSSGGISFYAANGTYDLSLVAASGAVTALRSQIILFDPLDCEDGTPTSSSTVLGETGGVVQRFAVGNLPFTQSGTNAATRTMLAKSREAAFSLNDFDGADFDAKMVNALAALTATVYPTAGAILVVPPGDYTSDAAVAIAAQSVTIMGYGAKLTTTASVAFDLGQDSYLTDLAAGYYKVRIEGLHIVPAAGWTGIRNKGVRSVTLHEVAIIGGATAIDTEGAWALSSASHCRFQSQTSHAVNLRQRNNLFTFRHCAFLASGARGVYLNNTSFGASPGAENKGLKFYACDWEGCDGALNVEGNVGNLLLDGCWWESNTTYNLRIDNTAGTSNKYGITIRNSQITGSGVDALIGTDATGTLIESVTIEDNEFADSDLIVISGDKVHKLYENNKFSGAATKTLPAAGLSAAAAGIMPRYETAPTEPFGLSASGTQGDVRYGNGRLWVKAASGWLFAQVHAAADYTSACQPLPTGATPSAAGLHQTYGNNGAPTTITNFTGGFAGQMLVIFGADGGNTTVSHTATIRLAGGVNFTLGDDDTITLLCTNATRWVEVTRSNNV